MLQAGEAVNKALVLKDVPGGWEYCARGESNAMAVSNSTLCLFEDGTFEHYDTTHYDLPVAPSITKRGSGTWVLEGTTLFFFGECSQPTAVLDPAEWTITMKERTYRREKLCG